MSSEGNRTVKIDELLHLDENETINQVLKRKNSQFVVGKPSKSSDTTVGNDLGNDHLIEFQLVEIVFYHLIEIMLIT